MRPLLVCLVALAAGCVTDDGVRWLSARSGLVQHGMDRGEVVELLGPPADRQFNGNREAWQYCANGATVDEYRTVWIDGGAVVGVSSRHYRASPLTACGAYFRQIDWGEAPDFTVEVRNR